MTKNTLPNLNAAEKALILRILGAGDVVLDSGYIRLAVESMNPSERGIAESLRARGLVGYLHTARMYIVEDARVAAAARQ